MSPDLIVLNLDLMRYKLYKAQTPEAHTFFLLRRDGICYTGMGRDLGGTAGNGPLLNLRWGTAHAYVTPPIFRISEKILWS